MKPITFVTIIGLCTLAGIAYWAKQQHYIIVNFNPVHSTTQEIHNRESTRNIKLHYWDQGTHKSENSSIVWQNNKEDTLAYIISSWLEVAYDAGVLAHKAVIETVMVAHPEHLYISLSENPLKKDTSTLDAWMNIEGLLKTIREANLTIKKISFLVHHKQMTDARLDFSQAWPIEGFSQQTLTNH